MDSKAHWDRVYRNTALDQVSWYQAKPELSLRLIRDAVPDTSAAIIEVGGGASTLVDGLVAAGYGRVTVLDISHVALRAAQDRLRVAASSVTWLQADVLHAPLRGGEFALWHDRAVFHFLTDPLDRRRYVGQVRRAVRPGGHVLVATFAADGPTHCSGLDVARYSPEGLHAEFGPGFRLISSVREEHRTPDGRTQAFTYCVCRAGEPVPSSRASQPSSASS